MKRRTAPSTMRVKARAKTKAPRPVDPVKVADLLRESMNLHESAKALRNRKVPNRINAREMLQRAAALRVEAHQLDPKHTAPAWAEEQRKTASGTDTHEALMDTYREWGVV